MTGYGYSKKVPLAYEEALERVVDELKAEGFGVLTEIDVKETLKKKLGVDFSPYVILGTCNPPLAYRALQTEEEIGLMLPCNVIVYVNKEGDTVVSALDPAAAMQAIGNPDLEEIAAVVQEKLRAVVDRV